MNAWPSCLHAFPSVYRRWLEDWPAGAPEGRGGYISLPRADVHSDGLHTYRSGVYHMMLIPAGVTVVYIGIYMS